MLYFYDSDRKQLPHILTHWEKSYSKDNKIRIPKL